MKWKSLNHLLIVYLPFFVLILLEKYLYFSQVKLPLDYYFLPAFCFEQDISFMGFYMMIWLLERALVAYADFSQNEAFIKRQAIYSIVRGQKIYLIHLKMIKDNLKTNISFALIKILFAATMGKHSFVDIVIWGMLYGLVLTILSNTLLNLYLLINFHICFPVFIICMFVYIVLFQKAAYSRMMQDFSIKGNVLLSFISTTTFVTVAVAWVVITVIMTGFLLKRREY